MDVALGTNYAQDFGLNVDLDLIDVNDVALPIIKFSNAKVMHHCCLVSSQRTLYILVLMKLLVFKS